VAAALLLSACATGERAATTAAFPTFAAEEVFSVGFSSIAAKYIEPVSVKSLVLDGLRGLGAIDPSVTVAEADGVVTLASAGVVVASRPIPQGEDARGWSRLAVDLSLAGRERSTELRTVSVDKIYEAVFDGALSNLDIFSRYAGPEEARRNRARRDGYGGIGVRFRRAADDVRITEVTPDSPAAQAGIRKNDRLTHVGKVPLSNLSHDEILWQLRGPPQSKIDITIRRDGMVEPLTFTLERAHIVPPTVSAYHRDGIIYAKIKSFNQDTAHSLEAKLRQMRRDLGRDFRGVVLDLRGNPGGLLKQAIKVTDLFLAQGRILTTAGRHPDSLQHYEAGGPDVIDGAPLAILIDGKSASAAEIVAAALQDRDRAVVVGTTSYGKGTVQTVIRLPNDGEITLTWSRFVAPSGYTLHGLGVRPAICTSGKDNDGAQTVTRALAELARTTATLVAWRHVGVHDDAQRQELRSTCPAETHQEAIDLEVADRLIRDRGLYNGAVGLANATAQARF
jgi:carboxyl-terminal processing protease